MLVVIITASRINNFGKVLTHGLCDRRGGGGLAFRLECAEARVEAFLGRRPKHARCIEEILVDLFNEPAGLAHHQVPPTVAGIGEGKRNFFFRSGKRNVEKSSLFFEISARIERVLRREKVLL
jgi:hypothetical protein